MMFVTFIPSKITVTRYKNIENVMLWEVATIICWTLVMAPKSVIFRRHDHLVSVLFGDLLSHSYNITFSMFLYLV